MRCRYYYRCFLFARIGHLEHCHAYMSCGSRLNMVVVPCWNTFLECSRISAERKKNQPTFTMPDLNTSHQMLQES